MTIHPRALEAAQRADERRLEREEMKNYVKNLTALGVRFVEIHPEPSPLSNGGSILHGRMTIAFIQDRRNVLMLATALCHPNDTFCKLTGRYLAGSALQEDRYITLRKPSYIQASEKMWLKSIFRTYGV